MSPQAHGRKAMLKYMHMLANSAIACEKFSRGGEGVKVFRDLMEERKDRKDVLEVLTKALGGAKPSVRRRPPFLPIPSRFCTILSQI